jgi:hypothetical protein
VKDKHPACQPSAPHTLDTPLFFLAAYGTAKDNPNILISCCASRYFVKSVNGARAGAATMKDTVCRRLLDDE